MFSTCLLIFSFFCISVIYGKKACDLEDVKCLTRAAGLTFVQLTTGILGVEPSDPLQADLIEANLPTVTYKVINGKLSGMKNCQVALVKFFSKDLKYNYHIGCPHLTLDTEYEIKGKFGPHYVEGKGTICKIDFYGYHFLFNGDYERKEGKDGKVHIHLKNHNLELEVKGKVHYEFQNLYNGDKEKSAALHKYVNENWQLIDKATRQPTMDAFMDKYIKNFNAYLDVVPFEDLFAE